MSNKQQPSFPKEHKDQIKDLQETAKLLEHKIETVRRLGYEVNIDIENVPNLREIGISTMKDIKVSQIFLGISWKF